MSDLAKRLRALLVDEPTLREVSMFGGRAFMVNGKIIVSALKDGNLLVRVAAEKHDDLLLKPGAVPAEMGRGREMGPGWITVKLDAIADTDSLSWWIAAAMDHNRTITGA